MYWGRIGSRLLLGSLVLGSKVLNVTPFSSLSLSRGRVFRRYWSCINQTYSSAFFMSNSTMWKVTMTFSVRELFCSSPMR